MAVNTILFDFSVDHNSVKNESLLLIAATQIENVLRDYLSNLKNIHNFNLEGGLVKIYTADPGATVNVRIYNKGLITLNLDYFKEENDKPILSYEVSHFLKIKSVGTGSEHVASKNYFNNTCVEYVSFSC